MAIKTLGSAQKIRVGQESGNTTFICLGLRNRIKYGTYTLKQMPNNNLETGN